MQDRRRARAGAARIETADGQICSFEFVCRRARAGAARIETGLDCLG